MQLTGSEILVECLKEQGVDTVFGYPGGAILNIYDALYKHGYQRSRRHESGHWYRYGLHGFCTDGSDHRQRYLAFTR